MSEYHREEHMRGRFLKDTRNGKLWGWTEALSKLPHMELQPEVINKPNVKPNFIKPKFEDVLEEIRAKK